jgi:hypothetical protein
MKVLGNHASVITQCGITASWTLWVEHEETPSIHSLISSRVSLPQLFDLVVITGHFPSYK